MLIYNDNLIENSACLDIDISNGIILEKKYNSWLNGYNIINPVSGYTASKCPTNYPVMYNIYNNTLVGQSFVKDTIIIYNDIYLIGCDNILKYTMRIGEFMFVILENNIQMVSVDIKYNNKTIYYVKNNIYMTDNIDLYDINQKIVANLNYTNNVWIISIYNDIVDYNILFALINYHQYYINGYTDDMCNKFIKVSYVIVFCALIILCGGCIIYKKNRSVNNYYNI
jgi:hypothetical protein